MDFNLPSTLCGVVHLHLQATIQTHYLLVLGRFWQYDHVQDYCYMATLLSLHTWKKSSSFPLTHLILIHSYSKIFVSQEKTMALPLPNILNLMVVVLCNSHASLKPLISHFVWSNHWTHVQTIMHIYKLRTCTYKLHDYFSYCSQNAHRVLKLAHPVLWWNHFATNYVLRYSFPQLKWWRVTYNTSINEGL